MEKIEDVNHVSSQILFLSKSQSFSNCSGVTKMQHCLEKVRNEVKNELIDDKKGVSGSNRLTQSETKIFVHVLTVLTRFYLLDMIINFKYYYRQAIVRNKTNLDDMVKAVWAIYEHKVKVPRFTLLHK